LDLVGETIARADVDSYLEHYRASRGPSRGSSRRTRTGAGT
jgi:hypothetical protein